MIKKLPLNKTSSELGFALRNRYLSQNPQYKIAYNIPSSSISLQNGILTFFLQSPLESSPFLKCQAFLYDNYIFNLTSTEISPLHTRFSVPEEDIINTTTEKIVHNVTETSTKIIWDYKNLIIEILKEPFNIKAWFLGKEVFILNERSLMNFERYREKGTILNHEGNNLIDTTGFDEDMMMWEEEFREFCDKKKRGPSSVGVDMSFCNAENVYGIPEHSDGLVLQDTIGTEPYRMFNSDDFLYEIGMKSPIYGSIPYMFSKNVGVLWLNGSDTCVDIITNKAEGKKLTHWYSESGNINIYILFADCPLELTKKFTIFTGPPSFPPLFALGYHQSRWNYFTQQEVIDLNKNFSKHNIPVDVFWLDIEHTNAKNYFTWDPIKFPNPINLLDYLALNGKYLVTIVDPHFRKDEAFGANKNINDNELWVKNQNGEIFEGECWSGVSSWLDFLNPRAREFWQQMYSYQKYEGSSWNLWIWNDMNEPAVFKSCEGTMPRGNIHEINIEHRDIHNLYGMLMHKSTYQGLMGRSNNKTRPFVLSRSFYASSHKYGPIWTGDNASSWAYLKVSIPMCLTLSSCGQSFTGADVGGFFGDPSPELMSRWIQVGTFLPFFRTHSHIKSKYREPWMFSENILKQIRQSIRLRYKLLPYFYTQFYYYAQYGIPIIRPMYLQYPDYEEFNEMLEVFHFGEALVVVPITEPGICCVEILLPYGKWYDFYNYKEILHTIKTVDVEEGKIPVFIKGGNTFFLQKPGLSTLKMEDNPYTIVIALDEDGKSNGSVFIDDGISFDYKYGRVLIGNIEVKDGVVEYKVNDGFKKIKEVRKIVIIGMCFENRNVMVEGDKIVHKVLYGNNWIVLKVRRFRLNENWRVTFNIAE
ncbi:hypothetical protein SteCoe_14215 [Stentor coeruleus]|uniref:Glucosidase II subunit alpha n=1 Tax=Stentor coeruleus TaxID=5963 RepID=A0A1R2C6G8_9CILI|nr:hypothetical protein SteCoe_14215 [Stentor coeruleus]